jgi:hypothetical protein
LRATPAHRRRARRELHAHVQHGEDCTRRGAITLTLVLGVVIVGVRWFFANKDRIGATTLARRMKEQLETTPLRFVQRLRAERAVQMLETTASSVEAVAGKVGYADPAAFRRVLRRETGRSPREFRGGR